MRDTRTYRLTHRQTPLKAISALPAAWLTEHVIRHLLNVAVSPVNDAVSLDPAETHAYRTHCYRNIDFTVIS